MVQPLLLGHSSRVWSLISNGDKAELDALFSLEDIRRVVVGFDKYQALGSKDENIVDISQYIC